MTCSLCVWQIANLEHGCASRRGMGLLQVPWLHMVLVCQHALVLGDQRGHGLDMGSSWLHDMVLVSQHALGMVLGHGMVLGGQRAPWPDSGRPSLLGMVFQYVLVPWLDNEPAAIRVKM